MADALNSEMVAVHNAYRLRHYGFNPDGSPLGGARRRLLQATSAANITLAWNNSLATAAAVYAAKCSGNHDGAELSARREGENM